MRGDEPEDDARKTRIGELILRLRRAGITEQRVVAAIESVPRDMFVPPESRGQAYAERALPIDCGQTISAPLIVGMMTAALDVGDRDRVLEIGTGTGYQAAESRFRTLRISNITTLVGDGSRGWPEQAPFDRIIVTAAAEEIPEALVKQLRVGGVMVLPVGPQDGLQKLVRVERTETGTAMRELADVRFVPLIPGKAERL